MTAAEELAQVLGAPVSEVDGTRLLPMLCEREENATLALGRADFLYEAKLDGVRIVADKRGAAVSLFYRRLREASESYHEIADAVRALPGPRLVLDGEIVTFDEEGRPNFQRLGHRIQTKGSAARRAATTIPVVYVVFDVLAVGRYDVRGFPLEARKEILSRIVPEDGTLVRRHATYSDGLALFRFCREHRMEGVVAKKLGSPYRVGERTQEWLKVKCEEDAEFVVIGWTEGTGTRGRLGALELATYDGPLLVPRGKVGSGLDEATIKLLLERLDALAVDAPVADGKYPPRPNNRHHVRPEIVVSVRYQGFTDEVDGGRWIRFPVFRGIRFDVTPDDCTVAPDEPALAARPARPSRRGTVLLSDGTTRDALCTYVATVAPALLRHARGRVCALLRPDGSALWPPPRKLPPAVKSASVRVGARDTRGYLVDALDVLVFAVEAGCSSVVHGPVRHEAPAVADFVALRVASTSREALTEAAQRVRALATAIGLPAAVKSAGPRALDVLLGVGNAPAVSAAPLGTILARLVGDALTGDVSVTAVDVVTTPFAVCTSAPTDPVVVSVPLGWEEVGTVDLATLGLAEAVRRASTAALSDALDAITDPAVDLAAATAAIERIVSR